jgi:hypothetical protein
MVFLKSCASDPCSELSELLRKIASDIEENLETQEIKVKLEGVRNFVQDRIENPFIYGDHV